MEILRRPSWISFKCTKYFGFVIGYWIFELFFRLFSYLKWDFFQIVEDDAENEYFYIIFLTIADLLSFFILPCEYKCSCKNLCYKECDYLVNKCEIKSIIKLFGLFLLDLLARSAYFIFHKIFDIDNEEVSQKFAHDVILLFDISLRIILYIFIFEKGRPGRHKVCSTSSLFISFGLLIFLDILNIIFQKKYDDWSKNLKFMGILVWRSFIFPIVDTIAKKLMEKKEKEIIPLQYMRYRGLIESVYLLIISLILYYTSNLHLSSDIFSRKLAIAASIYIFSGFIKAFLLLYVIYKFTSQSVSYLIISESLAGSIKEIIDFFNNEKNRTNIAFSIVEIILVILIGISTMIYEEIIIIRLCGLEKDTEEEIAKRGRQDSEQNEDEALHDIEYINLAPIN